MKRHTGRAVAKQFQGATTATERHARYLMGLWEGGGRWGIFVRSTDGGPTDAGRPARRAKGRRQRDARKLNRRRR